MKRAAQTSYLPLLCKGPPESFHMPTINVTRFNTSSSATEEDLIQFRQDVIALAELRGFRITYSAYEEEDERNIHPQTGEHDKGRKPNS